MTARQVDLLNILLMVFAFGLSLALPFELFLFSYAVLGPLHYLTEISWLNGRDFFLKKRSHAGFLVLICALVSAQTIYATLKGEALEQTLFAGQIPWLLAMQLAFGLLLASCFFIVALLNHMRGGYDFCLWVLVIAFVAVVAQIYLPYQYNFFSIMLPTLIHVSVFTALFILSGALHQNIISGYLVFVLYILICVIFFIPHALPIASGVYQNADHVYLNSGFAHVNRALLELMGSDDPKHPINILKHPFGFQVQSFIAFAYTYHYLNWFSKTGLVGWHRISRKRLAAILIAWLAIIALYIYDFRIGFCVLLFSSLLHVILEFPLNHKVMGQIAADMRRRLGERLDFLKIPN